MLAVWMGPTGLRRRELPRSMWVLTRGSVAPREYCIAPIDVLEDGVEALAEFERVEQACRGLEANCSSFAVALLLLVVIGERGFVL